MSKPRVKKDLESLQIFQTGATSKLLPHFWTYSLYDPRFFNGIRICSECKVKERIGIPITYVVPDVSKEDGYCQKRSIENAKRNGTFNPEYKEEI